LNTIPKGIIETGVHSRFLRGLKSGPSITLLQYDIYEICKKKWDAIFWEYMEGSSRHLILLIGGSRIFEHAIDPNQCVSNLEQYR
jgi:hypothetical protein